MVKELNFKFGIPLVKNVLELLLLEILIGNKCDILEKKVITKEQGESLADEFGIRFLETSAKSNIGVEEAFFSLARDIKKRLIDNAKSQAPDDKNIINPNVKQENSGGCCG
ncbi:hypothetical protein PIROE2DRAFT_56884 [Piromyces sp. E2]|nr:hypothetical protein PIROE2DRAFT_56884 [Piromyces sp. E2]|eukprot:OUM70195.1 hypothetical protein PIROE2DRAFT_56884 [Piromyces sp. E2]